MVDVVLIHPNGSHGIYGSLGDHLIAMEPPLWPRLIAGCLIDHGVSVAIIDAECEGLSPAEVALRVSSYAPRIVAIVVSGHQPSASTQAMPGARAIAQAICDSIDVSVGGMPAIVMMGNHPSALPERTLREEPVDYVIDGEGPTTLLGLLAGDQLCDIPGLVYWALDGDGVAKNPLAPLLDINKDLHGDAWHLLPSLDKYRSHNWQRLLHPNKRSPYAAIHTSLGCVFSCSFCMINIFQHKSGMRLRDPKDVVDEMVFLYKHHGVETFKMCDELFVLNRKHNRAICEGLIAAGLGDKISIWCYARPDHIDPAELSLFRRAGFDWFALGIEAGSSTVRDGADKAMTDEEIKTNVAAIEKAGINVIANYIFGLPGETQESMEATIKLAQSLNTAFANYYCAQAYPGSKLYDEAVAKGWTLPATWAGYSQHNEHSLPLASGTLTAAELLRFRDTAFDRYFKSQRYLDATTQRFGVVGRREIEKMTSYKLKRKLLEED